MQRACDYGTNETNESLQWISLYCWEVDLSEYTLKAIALSPCDPQLALWYYQLAITYIHQQRDNEAVEWARRGVEVNPNLRYPYRALAASLCAFGTG